MGSRPASGYVLDPDDPRAPTQAEWEAMTPEERRRVLANLPSEFPMAMPPPEGDPHRNAKTRALDALGHYFRRSGRRVYLSSELPVYYPAERVFAPDVLAVLDVEDRERPLWSVSEEGKGLDFVLEVHVSGKAKKDNEDNVVRYARIGIPEYFIFDRGALHLRGFRLSPGARTYQPIVPQGGQYRSQVLGLELAIQERRLRFLTAGAVLAEADELMKKLEGMVDDLIAERDGERARADELAARLEEERARLEEERARAERAEQLLEELRRQLEAKDRST